MSFRPRALARLLVATVTRRSTDIRAPGAGTPLELHDVARVQGLVGRGLGARRRLHLLLAGLVLIGAIGTAAPVEAHPHYVRLLVPALRLNTAIRPLACKTPELPDGRVYAWGCTPEPNRYLLSHAWGTFRPLRFAAERGQLKRGMRLTLVYPSGKREHYRLETWHVFKNDAWPEEIRGWLTNAERGISLQTCLYKDSSGRVVAHFVPLK